MIIFLYGEDNFRSQKKLLEIKQKYLDSDKSGSGLSLFDFADKADAGDAISACSTGNLLSPKRLVIVKRILAGSAEDQKRMLEFLKSNKNTSDSVDLVLVLWEENLPKKNNALFKFLETNSKKQNYEKLSGSRLSQWVVKEIKSYEASISQTALEKLLAYTDGETRMLDNEIKKLANFSGQNMITDKDVELLVRARIGGNIFSAIDALGLGNKSQAMKLLHDNMEKGEDPFYVMSMVVYQFRNMIKIAGLKNEGAGSEYEISRLTKMHPFVIRKTLTQTRNFSFDKLKKIYEKLARFDRAVKTGKMEMKLAIDKFVAEL